MFNKLKIKLILVFTLTVVIAQFITGILFILYNKHFKEMDNLSIAESIPVLFFEILLTATFVLFVGHLFVKTALKPTEDMFKRLTQFTDDASHELKTPISLALSNIDLALKTKKYEEYLLKSKQNLKDSSKLVGVLLDLTRMNNIEIIKSEINLDQVVDEILEQFSEQIKEFGIIVEKDLETIKVQGDVDLVSRAIFNLIDNAIKFNNNGKKIKIELNSKRFKISNTSNYINEEDLIKIFERFYKIDSSRSFKGYGIGLALVKRICEIHDWEIQSRYKADKMFEITISF